ncbi:RNA polymerase sigma factor [Gordonia sp. PS3]|uniref:RNA polymerase sigma factor n=1 Tax=Gordonia TaxID=2053 RepID=UPI0005EDDAAB|nr:MULTISPECIES: sigma-70 family RNA polymerase sigma factor [Gordonia]KJR05368.1 RNA polymerase sigma24 factor [Gordonia sihwensis]KXT56590.1 RNA polymerase sigma24 factor [Gordonia sp. QH-12]
MREPFDRIVAQHGAVVLRVCRGVLGAGPDADDAWSETFLAALRAWPDLEEGTDVEAWLVRVAQRKAIDVIRARARNAVPIDEVPERESQYGLPGTGDADVWDAVADLPPRQRLAVGYHYLARLSHVETAEIIGGTPAAVRRAAADGIRSLRKTYGTTDICSEKGGPR